MNTAVILFSFFILCVSIFVSLVKKNGSIISNGINLVTVSALSIYTLCLNEVNVFGIIELSHPGNILLAFVGFSIVLLICYGDLTSRKYCQIGGLYSFIFLTSYILLGTSDWINVFICYKLSVLTSFSLLEIKNNKLSKNFFVFEMLRSCVLILSIVFYFAGTLGFSFHNFSVVNQDFFLVSLMLFALFAGMELGLFPFHFWFENLLERAKEEKTAFYIFIRKIIFSYFMVTILQKLSMECDPVYEYIFLNFVKVYALVNIIIGIFFLLIHKNIIKIISSFTVINISLAYLCIILRQDEFSKIHLIFYIFCVFLPLLGMSLMNNSIFIKERDGFSFKKFAGLVVSNPWSGAHFFIFLLGVAGFPLTLGFSGKIMLYLDLLRTKEKWIVVILLFVLFFSMQVGFKIASQMFSSSKEKAEKINLCKKHLWIHAILALGIIVGGVAPSLFLKEL